MKALLLLSAVAATSAAGTLNAQATPAKPDSICKDYPDGRVECRIERRSARGDSLRGNRIFYWMDSAMEKRAALGLELRATGSRRDTLGVFVAAVTPKGPAETAGIIEGDRIAAINGVDLRTTAADVEDSYTNSLAAHRLTREVQKLTPGNRVTLRIYSGGRFRDVQVTAGKASDLRRLGRFSFRTPGPGGMMEFNGPDGALMLSPDARILRQRIDPLLRRRLENLPKKIQLRSPMRFKTISPPQGPIMFKVDSDDLFPDSGELAEFFEDAPMLDYDELFDGAPMLDFDGEVFDIDTEIEPINPEEIRELAASAIRDAQSALRQLAADQSA